MTSRYIDIDTDITSCHVISFQSYVHTQTTFFIIIINIDIILYVTRKVIMENIKFKLKS